MGQISRRTLLVGAGLAALSGVAGCTGGGGGAGRTPSPGPSVTPTPTPLLPPPPAPRLSRAYAAGGVSKVAGDLALIGGESRAEVVDLVQGRSLWVRDSKDPYWNRLPPGMATPELTHLVSAATPLVVGRSYLNPCPGEAGICHKSQTTLTDGRALVAMDAKTGEVRWHQPLVPPPPAASPGRRRSTSATCG
ncbi:PQQ-binding-like beta-propeller repeat protein [Naumannella sp. ID2617S]|nr:PQQ-binding-like beta-propeller repeat protein [Naumannella sp. ID2617S]